MQRIIRSKKRIAQAIAVFLLSIPAVLVALSQEHGIGQEYQLVSFNGSIVGCTSIETDVKQALLAARRELMAESDERLCMDYEWDSRIEKEPFVTFLTAEEVQNIFKEKLKDTIISEKQRAYTVAIDGYRANFSSLEEVKTFLDKVKAPSDEDYEFCTQIYTSDAHISGILLAGLAPTEVKEEIIPEATLADELLSGYQATMAYTMEYALANPTRVGYQKGILSMEFVEIVEVYENYVDADELSDIDEEVIEVTKEKESNKIYVVERGDCLSVIAMDHDTTVSSIMALNKLEDADRIREGQELIIAVPEPDLKIRLTLGEVYEEDYNADPIIIKNDSWYTTKQVVHEEGTTGHRERNDVVVYENGMEISREMIYENIMVKSEPAVVEQGTIIPPTYIKPLAGGTFTSGYGPRWGRVHKGVDWACPVGTTVYASCGGTVIQASYNGGYGNNVVISHPDGRMTRYAHNSKLLVKVGQKVTQGQPIALSGNTGRSTGPHVHFELYINGTAVNPLKYISY